MLPTQYKLLVLCVLLVLNSGCIRFVPYRPYHTKAPRPHIDATTYHRVKAGETLYSIAFEYGQDPKEVASWNGISDPYTIYPKQKLRIIPATTSDEKQKQVNKTEAKVSWSKKSPIGNNSQTYPDKITWSWPTQGTIDSTFLLSDPGRRGIDITGTKGQAVKAAAAGRVVYSGNGLRGYGNLIIIKHNETYFSAYAHMDDVVVKDQEKVKLGQRLADMSNTSSNKTKLHFEIRRNGKPVDPQGYLPRQR
jgi:lipoprotein NlpD